MDNFDLKKYLVENKVTTNSRMLNEEEQTTLDDIEWVKPQRRPRADISVKSGDGKYKTTFNTATGNFKCSCMGFWRSNGNCKHVKELKASLQG